ncbi:hypothetical protein BH09ACT8_BH09ACT8_59040 [soil metagenome]
MVGVISPGMGDRKAGFGSVVVLILAGGYLLHQCGKHSSASDAESPKATSTPTLTAEYELMAGDGYHKMGGADGKSWGVWESTGSPTPCTWSIRLTSPYTGATILDEGQALPSQPTRVSINPPGDTSFLTGEINGGRTIFQTQGCGSWRFTR